MMMTLSPQSTCGVKVGLCLPRSRIATIEASRPTTRPSASIMTHFLSTSAGLAENVLIFTSMNGIAPTKAGALRAYLSALGSSVNSGEAAFRHYFNEVHWRYYFTALGVGGWDRVGRG